MERCCDAHLFFANWGTRHLMLKLPAKLLGSETAARYEAAPLVEAWQHGGDTILSLTSDDEEAEWDDDLEGTLSGLIGVRTELAAGDLRPLYPATLAADVDGAWLRADALIAAKKQREYDRAIELLQDLHELAQRNGTANDFRTGITRIRDKHARKPSPIARLDHARLDASGPTV
ncbi:hypothetical protein OG216_36050 [Streptomycetaceae bacterium NBC_01309]